MNKYELAVVVTTKIDDEARAAVIERVKDLITFSMMRIRCSTSFGQSELDSKVMK